MRLVGSGPVGVVEFWDPSNSRLLCAIRLFEFFVHLGCTQSQQVIHDSRTKYIFDKLWLEFNHLCNLGRAFSLGLTAERRVDDDGPNKDKEGCLDLGRLHRDALIFGNFIANELDDPVNVAPTLVGRDPVDP